MFEGESVDKMEEGARKLEKCARSSSLTEFRFDDEVVDDHLWLDKLEDALHADALTRTFRRATARNMTRRKRGKCDRAVTA